MRYLFFVVLVVCVGVVSVEADPRYDVVFIEGRPQTCGAEVFKHIPAYQSPEGQLMAGFLERKAVKDLNLNGRRFWGKSEKGGNGVLLEFSEKKIAYVLVDRKGNPIYLVGNEYGDFFMRVVLDDKEKEGQFLSALPTSDPAMAKFAKERGIPVRFEQK